MAERDQVAGPLRRHDPGQPGHLQDIPLGHPAIPDQGQRRRLHPDQSAGPRRPQPSRPCPRRPPSDSPLARRSESARPWLPLLVVSICSENIIRTAVGRLARGRPVVSGIPRAPRARPPGGSGSRRGVPGASRPPPLGLPVGGPPRDDEPVGVGRGVFVLEDDGDSDHGAGRGEGPLPRVERRHQRGGCVRAGPRGRVGRAGPRRPRRPSRSARAPAVRPPGARRRGAL